MFVKLLAIEVGLFSYFPTVAVAGIFNRHHKMNTALECVGRAMFFKRASCRHTTLALE